MAEFNELIGRFILAGLVVGALFSALVLMQNDGNAEQPIVQNELFNKSYGRILNQSEQAASTTDTQYNVFNDEAPQSGVFSIVLTGIVSVGKSFSNLVLGFFSSIIKFPLVMLGVDPTTANLLTTWLVIGLITAAWLLYKLGG